MCTGLFMIKKTVIIDYESKRRRLVWKLCLKTNYIDDFSKKMYLFWYKTREKFSLGPLSSSIGVRVEEGWCQFTLFCYSFPI